MHEFVIYNNVVMNGTMWNECSLATMYDMFEHIPNSRCRNFGNNFEGNTAECNGVMLIHFSIILDFGIKAIKVWLAALLSLLVLKNT